MKSKRVLIIVAHSDDETIGMAGTIRKHVLEGNTVNVVSMTDGVGSRDKANQKSIFSRKESANEASKILGFDWIKQYDFPDNQLDSVPLLKIIKAIESVKADFKPELVYTHSAADLNIDHKIVLQATLTAFRPLNDESCKEIRTFEVPSATDYGHDTLTRKFAPNLFIDIQKFEKDKISALQAYSQEMKQYPNSRSVESIMNLAKTRGNGVGLDLAEAFQIIRKIEN